MQTFAFPPLKAQIGSEYIAVKAFSGFREIKVRYGRRALHENINHGRELNSTIESESESWFHSLTLINVDKLCTWSGNPLSSINRNDAVNRMRSFVSLCISSRLMEASKSAQIGIYRFTDSDKARNKSPSGAPRFSQRTTKITIDVVISMEKLVTQHI